MPQLQALQQLREKWHKPSTIACVFAAFETSFDEAGIAVCSQDGQMRFSALSSQVELHAPYGGCVPELAARTHLSDLPQMWRTLPQAAIAELQYLGVTAGPGLPGCLLAGINFARGVARALTLPLYGLNHLTGHIFSPFIPPAERAGQDPASSILIPYPHLALLISGGHTELYLVRALTDIELLGQTQDDAVGELLDKLSAMLGYGYPGGATLERIALSYPGLDSAASYSGPYSLPVPMRESGDLNFSYSGLKTACARIIKRDAEGTPALPESEHAALLGAVFSVVAQSLWIKVKAALAQYHVSLITVSGGVAINSFIRGKFIAEAQRAGVAVQFPAKRHCLDNAEMMAWLLKLTVAAQAGQHKFDADSNWNPGITR
jgi:N6-L-threonylcarbamoyladenine synthase